MTKKMPVGIFTSQKLYSYFAGKYNIQYMWQSKIYRFINIPSSGMKLYEETLHETQADKVLK